MVRPKLRMQPRNFSLGVAKQLGLDRPGEERQARAGALCALACVISARHLRKEVRKRVGWAGKGKKKGGKQQGWPSISMKAHGLIGVLQVRPSEIIKTANTNVGIREEINILGLPLC